MIWLKALPWRLIGIAAGALALVAILWWTQSRIRISYQAEQRAEASEKRERDFREVVRAAASRAVAKMEADALDDQEHAQKVNALTSELEGLRAARQRIPATVETPHANGTRLSINPDWWLCVSTAVSRDAADIAACQARAGAPGLPDAVRR